MSIKLHQITLLFISAFITGLCESNMAISQSMIVDQSTDTIQKTKLIGYAYAACSLGYMIGPLLGGAIGSSWSYSAPFWITALGVICITILILFGFQDNYVPNKSVPWEIVKSITAICTIFHQPKLYRIYLINFLIFFSVQGLYRVVPLYVMDQWKPPLSIYSLLIAFVSLLCLLTNLFILEILARRFSTANLLCGLLLLGGMLVIIIILPTNFTWIWITYGAAVIPTVMALPVCTTLLSENVSKGKQGQVLGNNQALLVLGESSSAAIGGLIAAIMIPLPIIIMGGILVITGIFILKDGVNNRGSHDEKVYCYIRDSFMLHG